MKTLCNNCNNTFNVKNYTFSKRYKEYKHSYLECPKCKTRYDIIFESKRLIELRNEYIKSGRNLYEKQIYKQKMEEENKRCKEHYELNYKEGRV